MYKYIAIFIAMLALSANSYADRAYLLVQEAGELSSITEKQISLHFEGSDKDHVYTLNKDVTILDGQGKKITNSGLKVGEIVSVTFRQYLNRKGENRPVEVVVTEIKMGGMTLKGFKNATGTQILEVHIP